jgi:hypothetical protein
MECAVLVVLAVLIFALGGWLYHLLSPTGRTGWGTPLWSPVTAYYK